jgi:hypothetical protein
MKLYLLGNDLYVYIEMSRIWFLANIKYVWNYDGFCGSDLKKYINLCFF